MPILLDAGLAVFAVGAPLRAMRQTLGSTIKIDGC
jgi:hypothetical protein